MSDFLTRRNAVVRAIRDHILDRYQVDVSVVPSVPPEVHLGDIGLPFAFALAKELKRAPREIAQEVLSEIGEIEGVSRMEVAGGGYVNVFLRRGEFCRELVEKEPKFSSDRTGGKIVVEHTNINPNKAAHIGHLRNAVLGDTLVRLFRFAGRPVEVQNYIDDTGVQVADVVVGFQVLEKMDLEPVKAIEKFDYYCWDLYAKVTQWYEEDGEHKQHRRTALASMEEGEDQTAQLAAHIAERIVVCHLKTMRRLGIEYDVLPHESNILGEKFWEAAFLWLRNKGAIHEETEGKNAGCWVMPLADSEAFAGMEDADKVLVRSDGTVTYVAKDIAYQMWKFGLLGRDFKYRPFETPGLDYEVWTTTSDAPADEARPEFGKASKVYNVIDVRQAYLQDVVREALRLSGFEKEAEASVHFAYEFVALSAKAAAQMGIETTEGDEGKAVGMSGRQGVGVKADDLLDLLEERAAKEVAQRNPEMDEAEVEETGRALAIGALRYFMLKFTRNKVIAFDFDEALAFEGETGPYLQYTGVRAQNILNKLEEAERWRTGQLEEHSASSVFAMLEDPETGSDVWELVRMIGRLNEFVEFALTSEEQANLTRYTFNLAQKFNNFYHKYPLLKEADDQLMGDRAVIVEVFLREYRKALQLLGIDLPRRM